MIGAAVLLAFAPSVSALGSATVINNCGSSVYYASVPAGQTAPMQEMRGSMSETYSDEGNGISIKLATSNDLSGPVTQFELTWANGAINYDLSNINGYPFVSGGMEVVPSMQNDASYPTCVTVNCPAGESDCTAAYNNPDDTATKVCDQNSNLVLTLCPGGGSAGISATNKTSHRRDVHAHNRIHSRHFK